MERAAEERAGFGIELQTKDRTIRGLEVRLSAANAEIAELLQQVQQEDLAEEQQENARARQVGSGKKKIKEKREAIIVLPSSTTGGGKENQRRMVAEYIIIPAIIDVRDPTGHGAQSVFKTDEHAVEV